MYNLREHDDFDKIKIHCLVCQFNHRRKFEIFYIQRDVINKKQLRTIITQQNIHIIKQTIRSRQNVT